MRRHRVTLFIIGMFVLQKGRVTVHPAGDVVTRPSALAKFFRICGLRAVLSDGLLVSDFVQ